jgi:hypothetical protein
MTYSYDKLSASTSNIIRELLKHKTGYSRTDDVSMTKDRFLFKQRCSRMIMTDF